MKKLEAHSVLAMPEGPCRYVSSITLSTLLRSIFTSDEKSSWHDSVHTILIKPLHARIRLVLHHQISEHDVQYTISCIQVI